MPGDEPRHDLAQTPTILHGQMRPEQRQRHQRRAVGLLGAAARRRGGAWSGLCIRHLLIGLRADVDTTATAVTKPIYEWLPQAAARDKTSLRVECAWEISTHHRRRCTPTISRADTDSGRLVTRILVCFGPSLRRRLLTTTETSPRWRSRA